MYIQLSKFCMCSVCREHCMSKLQALQRQCMLQAGVQANMPESKPGDEACSSSTLLPITLRILLAKVAVSASMKPARPSSEASSDDSCPATAYNTHPGYADDQP